MDKEITDENRDLIAAIGEIRFALIGYKQQSMRDKIEQALAVVDYAMIPYQKALEAGIKEMPDVDEDGIRWN